MSTNLLKEPAFRRAEPTWRREEDSGNLLPKKYIFLKTQQIQLILKERPEDTGQQPDYIHTCESPAPGERGKIQHPARRDPSTPPPRSQREEEGAQDC